MLRRYGRRSRRGFRRRYRRGRRAAASVRPAGIDLARDPLLKSAVVKLPRVRQFLEEVVIGDRVDHMPFGVAPSGKRLPTLFRLRESLAAYLRGEGYVL